VRVGSTIRVASRFSVLGEETVSFFGSVMGGTNSCGTSHKRRAPVTAYFGSDGALRRPRPLM
jgi:hypothetical protein